MKKLLICAGLLFCLSASNAAGIRALQETMSNKLTSLPRNLKLTAAIASYEISGGAGIYVLVGIAMGVDLKKIDNIIGVCGFSAISLLTGYLGHRIYKHTYTHEAQLAEQKAKAQQK